MHIPGAELDLENDLQSLTRQYGVSEPWEVLRAMRTEIYSKMVADPEVLSNNQWPHTVAVLSVVKETCLTAIVTGSSRNDALHVLHFLGLEHMVDLIVTGDDVKKGKPDPESYLLAAEKLGVSPDECLVLEDSVNGVKAALAAGMNVIAIATPFTNAGLHTSEIVEDCQIVHAPDKLAETVRHMIEEHSRNAG